jgi:hypothetical protein
MITPENIIIIVSDYFKVPIDKVLSTCRKKECVTVRQASMYFMRLCIPGIVLKEIGAKFPGKSDYKAHCTALYGINKVKGYIETDRSFRKDIEVLDKKITDLYNLDSILEHTETEAEKFIRLWDERERILISENKHLKEEITGLKSEISKLQGRIYGMKLNKKKPKRQKREYLTKEFIPNNAPNNHEYSGYREHQL